MPTETGLVRLRLARLPKLECKVADSSTVWRRLLPAAWVRLSNMPMISSACSTPISATLATLRQGAQHPCVAAGEYVHGQVSVVAQDSSVELACVSAAEDAETTSALWLGVLDTRLLRAQALPCCLPQPCSMTVFSFSSCSDADPIYRQWSSQMMLPH